MEHLNLNVPLPDEPLSALLARVAYRHVCRVWYASQSSPAVEPAALLQEIVRELDHLGLSALAAWVTAMAYYQSKGCTARQWRNTVIRRARQAQRNRQAGRPWQRVPPCY